MVTLLSFLSLLPLLKLQGFMVIFGLFYQVGSHCWSSTEYSGQEVSSYGPQHRSIETMTEIARSGLVGNNHVLDFVITTLVLNLDLYVSVFAAMVSLTKSICWKVVAKTVDSSGRGLVIYQKPTSESCYNHLFVLKRK